MLERRWLDRVEMSAKMMERKRMKMKEGWIRKDLCL